MVSSWPVDPPSNLGDDRVLVLGFDPVKIGKIPELLVLLYNLCILDNHFLVHTLTLFNVECWPSLPRVYHHSGHN